VAGPPTRLRDRRRCWALLALGLTYAAFGGDLIDVTHSGALIPGWLPAAVAGVPISGVGIIFAAVGGVLLLLWWWRAADPWLFGIGAATPGAWTISVFVAWLRGTAGAQLGPVTSYAGLTVLIFICALWPDP
jgi:hypothetical protein